MGKKTEFRVFPVSWLRRFIQMKAATIPFSILLFVCCNAFCGLPCLSALEIISADQALNVTLALKAHQFFFQIGDHPFFAVFFDIFQALCFTCFCQSAEHLLPTCRCRVQVVKDFAEPKPVVFLAPSFRTSDWKTCTKLIGKTGSMKKQTTCKWWQKALAALGLALSDWPEAFWSSSSDAASMAASKRNHMLCIQPLGKFAS